MKLHFRSKDGSILSVAHKCYLEQLMPVSASIIETKGHCQEQFHDMLPIFNKNWLSKIDRDTVVIYDQVGDGDEADQLRSDHISVIGAGKFHDKLELDRIWCMEWLDEHGIRTPETHLFGDIEKAVEFIKAQDRCLVFKVCGESLPNSTYVSQTPSNEDLLAHIDKLEKDSHGAEFILQEKIEGIEVSSEVWYYKGHPLLPHNHTFEEKKSMNDNLGEALGCAGNVVTLHRGACFIYDHAFAPIENELRVVGYTGVLDWNGIYEPTTGRLYIIEATSRFGYDAIQALLSLLLIPMSELFWKWGKGELEDIPLVDSLAIGVRVNIPIAVGSKDAPENEYIGGLNGSSDVWFSDVKMKGDQIVTAGWDGNILTATSMDSNVEVARSKVYSILDKLILGSKSYRTDIGKRFKDNWKMIELANEHYIKASLEYISAKEQEYKKHKDRDDEIPSIVELPTSGLGITPLGDGELGA